jgi:formylglycine-generating enzyme required for sulfatase activity
LLLYLGDAYDIRWNVNKFEPLTGRDDKPVSVTWYGALAFATFYGYDLPTTAEWEKGARGPNNDDAGEHLVYPWGDTIFSNMARYNSSFKAAVGSYGASGYGLHDIIGNVAEWTRSSNTAIETYSQQESLSASHNQLDSSPKLLRGGGYWDNGTTMKIYNRPSYTTTNYSESFGFRVIRRATP